MNNARAVITGIGIISPLGIGKQENWHHLVKGTSGINKLSRLSTSQLPVTIGAEVTNFDPKKYIADRKALKLSFFNVHLALAAAKLAVEDAGIELEKIDPTRFGAIIGSGGGGFDDGPGFEDLNEPILQSWVADQKRFDSSKFGEQGLAGAYPLFLLKALPNNAFYYISLFYNIQGTNDNIISSYTGGAQAIGDAFRAIRRGDADIIIAGGYDSLITPNTILSLYTLNQLSANEDPSEACRPFDLLRDGMIAGEGAGFLIIEEITHAQKRGAPMYAEVIGYGNASSAYHIYNPCPLGTGIERAVLGALKDAAMAPAEIDGVNADGIATKASDKAEACAYKKVFESSLSEIPVSATKSMTGHLGSASGAVEAAYSILSLINAVLPPTINYKNADPDCNINLVKNTAQEKKIKTALTVNQGIGGQTTALLFKKI